MPNKETTLMNEIILEVQRHYGPRIRLWRQNSGKAWTKPIVVNGKPFSRPIQMAVSGAADISGITENGLRVEIEVKTGKGKLRETQEKYRAMIEGLNGMYIVARSPQEAITELRKWIHD